jgi:hypothetical protein
MMAEKMFICACKGTDFQYLIFNVQNLTSKIGGILFL